MNAKTPHSKSGPGPVERQAQRGSALLLTTLVLVMVASALAGYLMVATATRRAVGDETAREQALYLAETAAAIAMERFAFDRVQAVSLVSGGANSATASVESIDGVHYLITARGQSALASRAIRLTIRRAPLLPHLEGPLCAYAAPGSTGLKAKFSGERFLISGFDKNLDGSDGAALPKPAIATRDDAAVDALYDALSRRQRERVIGDGSRPSIVNAGVQGAATALQVQDQVERLVNRAHEHVTSDLDVEWGAVSQYGNAWNPRLTHLSGNLQISNYGHVYGAGVLVIDGDLVVDERGYFFYDGIVVVRGKARVQLNSKRPWWWSWFPHWWWSGSRIRGGLVLLPTAAGTSRAKLEIKNDVEIHASEQALDLARRAARDVRPIAVESWREGPQ